MLKDKNQDSKLTILVVLYNCQFADSQTLKTINKFLDVNQWSSIHIQLFNNGPLLLSEDFDLPLKKNTNVSIQLHQDLSNVPLSWLYNQFIPDEGIYLLLDQDTTLTADYFEHLMHFAKADVNIFVPKLEHPGHKAYPICHVQLNVGVTEVPKLFSILSGLAIKKSLINQVVSVYGDLFDKRFAFYGIDATFFIRLNRMQVDAFYIGPLINHDLSGALTLRQIDYWRYRERAIDSVLQLRNYSSLRCCLELFKFFLRSPKISFFKVLPTMCQVFISGIHPRCL